MNVIWSIRILLCAVSHWRHRRLTASGFCLSDEKCNGLDRPPIIGHLTVWPDPRTGAWMVPAKPEDLVVRKSTWAYQGFLRCLFILLENNEGCRIVRLPHGACPCQLCCPVCSDDLRPLHRHNCTLFVCSIFWSKKNFQTHTQHTHKIMIFSPVRCSTRENNILNNILSRYLRHSGITTVTVPSDKQSGWREYIGGWRHTFVTVWVPWIHVHRGWGW